MYKRVIFTSDLLRVDKTQHIKLNNPQELNIDWLYELLAPEIGKVLGIEPIKLVGSKGSELFSRLRVYKELEMLISTDNWAKLYEGAYKFDIIEKHLHGLFNDALVVLIEAPPYMIKYFIMHNINYIDFTIHPVRFLPDYILGFRTNVDSYRKRAQPFSIKNDVFKEFSKKFKAKSKRVFRTELKTNSAVFLGQTEIDASLILGGRVIDINDIEFALMKLTEEFDWVYFKSHPHSKINNQLKVLVSKIPRCSWLETNIYMLLSKSEIECFASMSSGSLEEAKIFGNKTKRIMNTSSLFDLNTDESKKNPEKFYMPMNNNVFSFAFWNNLLTSNKRVQVEEINPYEDIIKASLNIKWGI